MGATCKARKRGWDGTAPASSTDALFGEGKTVSRQRGCTAKVVSVVVAAAIAKAGEILAPPSGVRYRQDDLATEGESLKGRRINQALKLQASPGWFT